MSVSFAEERRRKMFVEERRIEAERRQRLAAERQFIGFESMLREELKHVKEVIQGEDNILSLEGWAKELVERINMVLQKTTR